MDTEGRKEYIRKTLRLFVENMPSLRKAVGAPERVDEFLNKMREDSVIWKGLRLHLEIYETSPADPVLIFHGGIGTYVRFYLWFLALLCERGFNIIAVDCPGHGFFQGRPGDCTVEDAADFTPLVMAKARELFHDRIGMMGSSLGGIVSYFGGYRPERSYSGVSIPVFFHEHLPESLPVVEEWFRGTMA